MFLLWRVALSFKHESAAAQNRMSRIPTAGPARHGFRWRVGGHNEFHVFVGDEPRFGTAFGNGTKGRRFSCL